MVEISKKKFNFSDRIKLGTAQEIPFEDNYFDCLIMIEVLRYFDLNDIKKALKESHRVLKPGGKIFCTFVNKWSLDFFICFKNKTTFKKENLMKKIHTANFLIQKKYLIFMKV